MRTELILAFLALVALALLGLRFGLPALRRSKHRRCLRRIEAREIALGLRPDPFVALHMAKAANFTATMTGIRPEWERAILSLKDRDD